MPEQAKINFYPFSDGAALHQVGSHRLWVLNHTSAVLWCLFEEHGASDQLIHAYAEHFNIPALQASADVERALAYFVEISNKTPNPSLHSSLHVPHPSSFVTVSSAWQKHYRVAGKSWGISCDDADAAESWFGCLGHLVTENDSADLFYSVVQKDQGWTITSAAENVEGLAYDEVLPSLLTLLFGDLCAALPNYLLLHAAVAMRDDHLILLPGESAFGKSTLSAALAASGWTLLSDELAPLDTEAMLVVPFNLPVGIKRRSLEVLQPYYPELAEQPACTRLDGHVVRYLAPPQINLAESTSKPAPVAALVFPRFIPDAATRLEPLAPLQALELLANTGSSERPLLSQDIEALLELAGQRPCWSVVYSNLEEAVEVIKIGTRDEGRGTRKD